MVTQLLAEPKELIGEHVDTLRDYARRVLSQGETLTAQEDKDRAERVREFLALGKFFNLTYGEMVTLLYRGLFDERGRCGCGSCRSRQSQVVAPPDNF